jgi:hypothetical protein
MTSPPASDEPSQLPDPPGPTSEHAEPPRTGPHQALDGALTAAGAWPLIRKQVF